MSWEKNCIDLKFYHFFWIVFASTQRSFKISKKKTKDSPFFSPHFIFFWRHEESVLFFFCFEISENSYIYDHSILRAVSSGACTSCHLLQNLSFLNFLIQFLSFLQDHLRSRAFFSFLIILICLFFHIWRFTMNSDEENLN